jgi:GAG-pre-integrase domain
LALAAQTKKPGKKRERNKSDITCKNCKRTEHGKLDCYSKREGKEGQGPRQRLKQKAKKSETVVVATDDNEKEMFAFMCMSDYVAVTEDLDVPKSKLGTYIDSSTSQNYCPDCTKFSNYKSVQQKIPTANGMTLAAIGMGDLYVELPNGSQKTKVIFKYSINAPDMAFTLLSISWLDQARFSVICNKEMCTIRDLKGHTIATVPHSDGLYQIAAANCLKAELTANTVYGKMSIRETHRRLGHIAHSAIRHTVTNGLITGINLDMASKSKFCKACAKAKLACQHFLKKSDTRAEKLGNHMHWDLWGPASVKSINSNHYVAAHIDNATRQTKLYFQAQKSQTFDSYKKDKVYIEIQSSNHIKIFYSNKEGEFQSTQIISYQDSKGTKQGLTVHDSPLQSGVSESK